MIVAKKPKARIAEQRYIKRAREIREVAAQVPGRPTPWIDFFQEGPGAELETEIKRSSIHSIIYSYGKKLNKKFICSYEEKDGVTLVKLEAVKRRE
jgi:hypothetical protein